MIIDWQQIDTVMLDMDGTLLDLHYDNYFWQQYLPQFYADHHELSFDAARAHLMSLFRSKEGLLEWYCVDYWSEQLNMDVTALKGHAEVRKKIRFRPQAEGFLQQLSAANKRVWLVTNAHRKVLDLKHEVLDLERYFQRMVSSHDFGFPKELQQFWLQLKAEHDFDPQRTLFIDDSLPVLRSAQQFGIGHLRAILQPDLLRDNKDTEEFLAIDAFDHVTPNAA